jgi:formylglycine-generating enzyme required for sulfatase activity
MSYPASVSTFALDKYEVTVGRFRAFVNAGMGTLANPPAADAGAGIAAGTGWDGTWNSRLVTDANVLNVALQCDPTNQTWTNSAGVNENLPINCVNWYEAFAFCVWDGGRLATETEWDYAAAGGSEQREYPWGGTTPDANLAVYGCLGDGYSSCAFTDILPVGSRPAGNARWGHSDLAGSMWEWVFDWSGTYLVPCGDCAEVVSAFDRVGRGGSFGNDASIIRTAYRDFGVYPAGRAYYLGVRCAVSGPLP